MNSIFYKLDKEKQKRIINASLYVFSKSNFKHGSTDDIAAEAQIAKGSLFQYFKNKKTLYIFLYDYALKELERKADELFDFNERDYFMTLKSSMLIKARLLSEYPYLYDFVIRANEEQNPDIQQSIQEINSKREIPTWERFYGNIDYSKFKEGIDLQNLNKMITWCAEGIWKEGLKNQESIESMNQQTEGVLDFFRNAVYKEENLYK